MADQPETDTPVSSPSGGGDTKKRVGRPPKTAKRPVGRPKGEASIMKEYRERMLNSPKSRKVLDAIMTAALDDDHKNQAAAWKLIMDRVAPVSGFEGEIQKSGGAALQINITTVGSTEIESKEVKGEIIDGDY